MDFQKYLIEDAIPVYNIYHFTDKLYKVVRFNGNRSKVCGHVDRSKFVHYDKKIDPSLSRSRRTVLELSLCNYWEFFCTFTVAEANYDRYNLDRWHNDFAQWLRDLRKKIRKKGKPCDIEYLIVPEQHADGAWHMHGLFRGVSDFLIPFSRLDKWGWYIPKDLADYGYYVWPDNWFKFGFNSLARIQNPVAVGFYISKYITKSMSDSVSGDNGIKKGSHLYYNSRGLNRPEKHLEVYYKTSGLDKWLTHHYEFCSTGMVSGSSDVAWNFGFEYADCEPLECIDFSDPEAVCEEADNFYDFVQLAFMN